MKSLLKLKNSPFCSNFGFSCGIIIHGPIPGIITVGYGWAGIWPSFFGTGWIWLYGFSIGIPACFPKSGFIAFKSAKISIQIWPISYGCQVRSFRSLFLPGFTPKGFLLGSNAPFPGFKSCGFAIAPPSRFGIAGFVCKRFKLEAIFGIRFGNIRFCKSGFGKAVPGSGKRGAKRSFLFCPSTKVKRVSRRYKIADCAHMVRPQLSPFENLWKSSFYIFWDALDFTFFSGTYLQGKRNFVWGCSSELNWSSFVVLIN